MMETGSLSKKRIILGVTGSIAAVGPSASPMPCGAKVPVSPLS